MIQSGQYRLALHGMWLLIGVIAGDALQNSDLTVRNQCAEMVQLWLQQVGCLQPDELIMKLRKAETFMRALEQYLEKPSQQISK